ncbi:hypothetical protein HQ571_05590 [Candidatus Kuenenbacteria bacterium]|nr:hypothetical protein [Candidatus Kuenenbacteria bacterium]
MKNVFISLAVSVVLLGCTSAATNIPFQAKSRPWDYKKIAVIDENVVLEADNNVSVSAFGYNPRKWEQSQIQNFHYPLLWLKNPRLLEKDIYIVKNVGRSMLFCSIRPEEKKSSDERKNSAQYNLFLVKTEEIEGSIVWMKFLEKKYGSKYYSHRRVDIGEREVIQLNWNADFYWNSPTILAQYGGTVNEIILLYSGTSRTYVNQIMNKFPWRAFTLN